MQRHRAAILGGSGFAGAELSRHLLAHPAIELVRVCAKDHVGLPLASAHLNLEGRSALVFEDLPAQEAIEGVDVVLMGLPPGPSAEVVQAIGDRDVRVLDLSGAFRLRSAEAYERWYGPRHPAPDLLPGFVYGLPELNRQRLRGARRVASPGCFATTVELGLLPFAQAGLLKGAVRCVGVTASSGSGAVASATTHHPTRSVNLRTYKPLTHPHTPEIVDTLTQAGARDLSLDFVPVSAPLSRGLFATSFFEVPAEITEERLRCLLRERYRDEPFVRVPAARLPEVIAVSGSNYAEVGLEVGEVRAGRRPVAVFSALDNLMKGGAGQAIQNLNLMLELEERLTLEDPGGFP